MRRAAALSAVLALLAQSLAVLAQEPPGSIRREVSVTVRTLPVVVTDREGNPPASPPLPEDLEVREEGVPVEVLGVDPIAAEPGPAAGPAPAPAEAIPPVAAAPAARRRTAQYLYVDTSFLRTRSVKEVVAAVTKELPRLLSIGPLEVVVADPAPRVFFPASADEAALRTVLDGLAKKVPGRDRVVALRKELIQAQESDPKQTGAFRSRAATAPVPGTQLQRAHLFQEAAVIREGMGRLARWAASFPTAEGGIVYLASDGFDVDQAEFYSNVEGVAVRTEVTPMVEESLRSASQALLSGGFTTVPIALNASASAPSASAAEFTGRDRVYTTLSPTSGPTLMLHPLDPLREYAETTGGEVLVSAGQLAAAARRLSSRYVVSWKAREAPDGRVHRVTVRSRNPQLVVRAARGIPAGTPQARSAAKALDVLEGAPAEGGLPLEVSLGHREKTKKGRFGAPLSVKVTLADLKPLLDRTGAPRMRVSVAVEIPGSIPFVWHEERDLPGDYGKGWIFEMPIEWPDGAQRIGVVVEELRTGLWAGRGGDLEKAWAPSPAR